MKFIVQRVSEANVCVDNQIIGEIKIAAQGIILEKIRQILSHIFPHKVPKAS